MLDKLIRLATRNLFATTPNRRLRATLHGRRPGKVAGLA
jgi:hypothetical protein